MTSMNILGCLLLLSRICVDAKTLPLDKITAFTFTRRSICQSQRRPYNHSAFELQAQLTKEKQQSFQLNSLHDFDEDLANDIHDELASVGVDENGSDGKDVMDKHVNRKTKKVMNKIVRPPIAEKTNQLYSKTPPHTALAQVIANQYSIDLASVSPSAKGPGSKITAEDVEYHAWKISQPPCTEEALELAYSMDLDLSALYDDEDREYVMQMSDIKLFQENEASLKMASQTRKGMDDENTTESSRKRMRRMSALDKRMEQNTGKLAQKALALAGTVTSGILEKASEKLREVGVLAEINGKKADEIDDKTADEINAVEDFDSSLAREIQEALSSVYADESSALEPVASSMDAEMTDYAKAVEVFDSNLASEIQEALSSIGVEESNALDPAATDTNGHLQSDIEDSNPMEPVTSNAKEELQSDVDNSIIVDPAVSCARKELQSEFKDSNAEEPAGSYTIEELQSRTVVQLKDLLRRLGMKVSGRKAELVDRIFGANDVMDENKTDQVKSENLTFFVAQGTNEKR